MLEQRSRLQAFMARLFTLRPPPLKFVNALRFKRSYSLRMCGARAGCTTSRKEQPLSDDGRGTMYAIFAAVLLREILAETRCYIRSAVTHADRREQLRGQVSALVDVPKGLERQGPPVASAWCSQARS